MNDFPLVKLKSLVNFPANTFGRNGMTVTVLNGNYYLDIDYSRYAAVSAIPPGAPNQYMLMWDGVLDTYVLAPVTLLGGGGAGGIIDAPIDGAAYGRQSAAWQKVLAIAGGTMTGSLLLAHDPTQAMEATTKEYVDTAVQIGFVPTKQIVTAPGDVTVAPNDGLIILNKTVGQTSNILMPAAATKLGPVKVVDWKGDASINNFTIIPAAGELISGQSTWVVGGNNASLELTPVVGSVNGYAV